MLIDNNLIAYEYFKNQYVPNEIYPSGEKDETGLIDKYNKDNKTLAVLILEFDIVNKDGYGLRRGFYNVVPDKYLDYLLIYQKGDLKAKIPVFEMNVFETLNPKQDKPKKMSAKKYQNYLEKERKKYYKGLNPDEVDYKNVETQYIKEQNAIIIIYSTNNLELKGMIKL